jgi:hypothetical protein
MISMPAWFVRLIPGYSGTTHPIGTSLTDLILIRLARADLGRITISQ